MDEGKSSAQPTINYMCFWYHSQTLIYTTNKLTGVVEWLEQVRRQRLRHLQVRSRCLWVLQKTATTRV